MRNLKLWCINDEDYQFIDNNLQTLETLHTWESLRDKEILCIEKVSMDFEKYLPKIVFFVACCLSTLEFPEILHLHVRYSWRVPAHSKVINMLIFVYFVLASFINTLSLSFLASSRMPNVECWMLHVECWYHPMFNVFLSCCNNGDSFRNFQLQFTSEFCFEWISFYLRRDNQFTLFFHFLFLCLSVKWANTKNKINSKI